MQFNEHADQGCARARAHGDSVEIETPIDTESQLARGVEADVDAVATEIADLHHPFAAETLKAWRAMRAGVSPEAHSLVNALFLTGIPQLCAKRVALHLGISRSSLHRLCSQRLRCSVKILIGRARAAVAALVLANPGVRVSTAASFLGFQDTATLRRLVRQHSGLSVEEMRLQIAVDHAVVEATLIRLLSRGEHGVVIGRCAYLSAR